MEVKRNHVFEVLAHTGISKFIQAEPGLIVAPFVHERNNLVPDPGVVLGIGGPMFPGQLYVSVVVYHEFRLCTSRRKVKGNLMATATIRVHDEQVKDLLRRLESRMTDLTPAMRAIGEIVRESVMRNFAQSRSPEGIPWKRSLRAKLRGGMTLIDTATLKNSIHVRADKTRVRVGSPVRYAAVHQFGARAGSFGVVAATVKAHVRRGRSGKSHNVRAHTRRQKVPWGDIPARPFLGVRREDWGEIRETILDYLVKR